MRLSLILTATAAVFSHESSAAGGQRQVRAGGIARMDQGRRAREGVDGQGTINNPVIVPEELAAGVITGGLERAPGSAPLKPPRRRPASRHPGRADISRILVTRTGTKQT